MAMKDKLAPLGKLVLVLAVLLYFFSLLSILLTVVSLVAVVAVFLRYVLRRMYFSITPMAPTADQLRETRDAAQNFAIFRHLPQLREKVAWRPLGNFPTPIHVVRHTESESSDGNFSFFAKREDLSSGRYGGNKVRTLQFQLASCEAHSKAHPDAKFFVMGSAGSNQCVATRLHGAKLGVHPEAVLANAEAGPDFENSLNVLTNLSFPHPTHLLDRWANLKNLVGTALFGGDRAKVFPPGGNNVTGVLGQMGGMLELAEQIERGDLPDIEAIYLPVGSNCTLTGLCMGAVLARHLGLPAFKSKDFKIVGVPIHHALAKGERLFGMMRSHWFQSWPILNVRFSVNEVSKFIRESGGPDLAEAANAFLDAHLELVVERDLVGKYGGHSEPSKAAMLAHDECAVVEGEAAKWSDDGEGAPPLWLCGHFSAKPYSLLIKRLRESSGQATSGAKPSPVLFWSTKSVVQPLGPVDEWEKLQTHLERSDKVKEFFEEGKAHAPSRQGTVRVDGSGDPDRDYRHLFTKVD
jgi:1-aminocyclopropane-1-carboxylate deaminase/D-cysteine desulfhydrase-like pyridoxal-dependent ACC family enzyme